MNCHRVLVVGEGRREEMKETKPESKEWCHGTKMDTGPFEGYFNHVILLRVANVDGYYLSDDYH